MELILGLIGLAVALAAAIFGLGRERTRRKAAERTTTKSKEMQDANASVDKRPDRIIDRLRKGGF
jgi:hypothetical protein